MALALARAAVVAHAERRVYGEACGLRVRPGPVVLVSYEDTPLRLAKDLERMGGDVPDAVHCWPEPGPLFVAGTAGAQGEATAAWRPLWDAVARIAPSLVVVDPVSEALAGALLSEGGPVRAFVRELRREATAIGCGVLLVTNDTKTARNLVAAGKEPGSGAVVGSATWFDAACGVLYFTRSEYGRRIDCLKANYGASGWSIPIRERIRARGRFAGFEVDPDPPPGWNESSEKSAGGRKRVKSAGNRAADAVAGKTVAVYPPVTVAP